VKDSGTESEMGDEQVDEIFLRHTSAAPVMMSERYLS
jgi:hypothetical protein